jgi:hypothetical protein
VFLKYPKVFTVISLLTIPLSAVLVFDISLSGVTSSVGALPTAEIFSTTKIIPLSLTPLLSLPEPLFAPKKLD